MKTFIIIVLLIISAFMWDAILYKEKTVDCYLSPEDSLAIEYFNRDTFARNYMEIPAFRLRVKQAYKEFEIKEEKRKNKVK